MKAMSMIDAPIWISSVPVWLPKISAMAPASAPESANAPMMTRLARTPSMRAIEKFSAAARISRPKRVRRRNSVRPIRMAMVATMVMSWSSGSRAPKISTGCDSTGSSEIDFGRLEKSMSRKYRMTKPSAKDEIIMVAGLARRNRLNTTISHSTESPAPQSRTKGTSRYHGNWPAKTMAMASVDGQSSAKTLKAMTSPWAKFTSRMTPKMRAMPSAPSA